MVVPVFVAKSNGKMVITEGKETCEQTRCHPLPLWILGLSLLRGYCLNGEFLAYK